MSIWNPATWFERKESAAGALVSHSVANKPVWTPRDYNRLAKEAYEINPVAFRCVKLISTSAASVPFLLFDKDGVKVENSELLDLLRRPAPTVSGVALFEAVFAYLLLAGNSYIERVGPDRGPPRELWALRPDRMKAIAGPVGVPRAYEYSVSGAKRQWPVDPVTGQSDVLHIKEFSPTDDWYGLSRVEAAAQAVDRNNASSAHNKALLDNGARPSGALVFKPVKGGSMGGVTNAPVDILQQAEKELRARHGGSKNAGRPLVLGGDVDWLEIGMTPKDMDFEANKDDSARDICLAFGVPPVLVVKGASTFNNVSEAKLELWENTILPLMMLLADELNNWLVPAFGDGLRLAYDLDSISALEPRRKSKRTSTIELLDKGVITTDEARAALQYGPMGDDVVRKVDAQVLRTLIDAVDKIGMTPLYRYALSVGIIEPGTTEDQLVADMVAFLDELNSGAMQ